MTLTIEMVSDLVCPWCWVGLRRFEAAMAMVPEIEVEVLFRPYELDPSIPAQGVEYEAYMRQRFGSDAGKERMTAMRAALVQAGAEDSIPFAFDRITRRPNSFNAHRVVRWAQGQGKGLAAKEALFKAFFAQGKDIGDTGTLIGIAAAIDLDPDIIEGLLASDADVETTRQEQALFRQMGVSAVPTFIAHRSIAVQGAESADKLAQFLKTAAKQMPTERPASSN